MKGESRTVARDLEVAAIPYGEKIPLKAGSTVFLTQSLGGSFTVMTDMGYIVRVEGKDADAIGEQPVAAASPQDLAGKSVQELAWDKCVLCMRCACPIGISIPSLIALARSACRERGVWRWHTTRRNA